MAQELLRPPEPPRPFVGRTADLERLQTEVYRSDRRFPETPIVVLGEAGIGKSALVAEFLTMLEQRERSIWIQCRKWASELPMFETTIRDRESDFPFRSAIAVLDGADEIDDRPFMDIFHRVMNFKRVRTVVITSRTEIILRGVAEIRLDRLPEREAETLIRQNIRIAGLDEQSLTKLISAVNGHPLAISLIGGMAKEIDQEHLKRVLAGHLYDLDDAPASQREELVAAAEPVIVSANEAMIKALKDHPRDIFRLSPRKYEELIADLLDDMGYEVTLTKATRDGGKDILASMKTECGDVLCLVDAKKYRHDRKIGVSMVRTLYGTLCDFRATSGMIATTSTFSPDARAFQQNHQYQLTLKDYADVAGWIQKYGSFKKR